MSLEWSLKELYESFECDAFKQDMQKLQCLIESYSVYVGEVVKGQEELVGKLEQLIGKEEELWTLATRLNAFVHLTLSADSKHALANKLQDQLRQLLSQLPELDAKVSNWLNQIEAVDEVINASKLLKEHEFYLKERIQASIHKLSDKEESLLAKLQNTGSSAWLDYKNLLISMHKVEVEIDGEKKEMPLTALLNLANDSRSEVRKKAYEAEIEAYKRIEDGIAAALNGIKGEVLTVAKARGYESPLAMTLEESRMEKSTLDAMLKVMEEYLPVFRQYLRRKAEMLGYTNGLPFYELYAPVVDTNMEMDYAAGKAFVEKNFRAFSDTLGDYAVKAFDNHWLDVYPKEGKRGGAFCYNLRCIGESRILLNHGDTLSDVITMAHELGHGFHGQCLNNESILNTDYPMPLAETASNFCETIVKQAAINDASSKEAFAILETEISDATQVIVDIYSRYLFESEIFEKRAQGALSVDEIKGAMLCAQQKAYGEGLDPNYLHPYMWTWKPHYYYSSSNFYNFPYAFGLLFSKGLYAKYLEQGEVFVAQYEALLAATGKNTIADVAKVMGIDVNDETFWRESLDVVKADIERFIELSGKIG